MKKNHILLIVLIALIGVTAYLVFNYKNSTLNEELTDFAIEDTASINKIFLADKLGKQVTLTKKAPGKWLLNDSNIARPEAVELLLYTIKNIEVRSPVGRLMHNQVVALLSSNGVKVEIYQNGQLAKTYYVGGPTQDHLGTFMYLQNSSVPFITHIPGFNGFLTPRYFTNINNWKDRTVFNYPQGSIAQLKISDIENPAFSFTIKQRESLKEYEIYDASGNLIPNTINDKIAAYLDFYSNLFYEGVAEKLDRHKADSLATTGKFLIIDIKDQSGNNKHVEFIRKPVDRRSLADFDEKGDKPKYDLDRMLTRIDNDTALVTTQYQLYNILFQQPQEFTKNNKAQEKK